MKSMNKLRVLCIGHKAPLGIKHDSVYGYYGRYLVKAQVISFINLCYLLVSNGSFSRKQYYMSQGLSHTNRDPISLYTGNSKQHNYLNLILITFHIPYVNILSDFKM